MSKWKIVKISLILISIVFTIYNVYLSLKNKIVINILGFFSSLTPLMLALYAESDTIYTLWNKLMAYFKNRTVSFKPEFEMINIEEDLVDLNYLEEKINKIFDKYEFKSKINTKNDEMIRYEVKNKHGLKNDIYLYLGKYNYKSYIKISFSFQISYRDINKEWDYFNKFKDDFISDFKYSSHKYDVVIDTESSKINPFYKITLKIMKPFEIENINLKIKNDYITFTINKNKIYANSTDKKAIDDVIKNYIPLTKVY